MVGRTNPGLRLYRPPDVEVRDLGSLVLFLPVTEAAGAWIDQNVEPGANWFCGRLVVQRGYAPDILGGMGADGLSLVRE